MKRGLLLLAAAVLLSTFSARGDAVAWDGETPPLVLTNVTVQIWGDAELREEIPQEGLLFLREDGELYVGDGVTPGGRPVCKGTPDWHVFHKELQVNGNEIKLNSTLSEQASGAKLTWTADGEKVFWILSADEAEGGQSSWERLTARMTNGYLLLTAYTTNENAVVLSITNLLSTTSWAPCTNAVLEAYTATSRTWRITQQAQAEFYRVRKDVPVTPVGIYAGLPLVALRGVTMDGVTVTNWGQITDAIAAVSSALTAHTSATNPHGITAEGIGALTNETDAVALAALVPVEARVGALEEAAWSEFYVQWAVTNLSELYVNWIPTDNWPARSVVVNITMGSMSNLILGIPAGFEPEEDCAVTFRVLRGGNSGSLSVRIGDNYGVAPITSGNNRYVFIFRWLAGPKTWVLWRWNLAYVNAVFNSDGENKETTGIPEDARFAPVINVPVLSAAPQLIPGGGLSPAIIQPDAALNIGSLENLDGLDELDEPEESWNEDVLEEEKR